MKLVPLGETDAAACVDGVCEVPQQPVTEVDSAGPGAPGARPA